MSEQQAASSGSSSAREAARDALVSSAILYGLQLAFIAGATALLSRRYLLAHARWRWEQWRTRAERAESAALAEVRRDISRLEHGDSMPSGGPPEAGLYGGLR